MPAQLIPIENLVQQTKDLPTVPEAALKVVRQSNDESATPESVAKTLASDQALAARVLRLANSAYYGLPRQVTTLQDATVVLGMRTVRHIALLASTFPWLTKALPGYDLAPQALWRHSFSVALCAQILAKQTRFVEPEEAFTAGLLHDIGKIVMSVWMEDELASIVRLVHDRQITFDRAEYETFGFTHAEVGGYLAREWNLPESLVKAITFHHNPESSDSTPGLVEITHLADVVCISLGMGIGGDGLLYRVSRTALHNVGLSEIDLECGAEKLIDTIAKSQPMFEFK